MKILPELLIRILLLRREVGRSTSSQVDRHKMAKKESMRIHESCYIFIT